MFFCFLYLKMLTVHRGGGSMHKGCKCASLNPPPKKKKNLAVVEDTRSSGSEGLRQSGSQSSLTAIPTDSVDSRLGDGDSISKNKTEIW